MYSAYKTCVFYVLFALVIVTLPLIPLSSSVVTPNDNHMSEIAYRGHRYDGYRYNAYPRSYYYSSDYDSSPYYSSFYYPTPYFDDYNTGYFTPYNYYDYYPYGSYYYNNVPGFNMSIGI